MKSVLAAALAVATVQLMPPGARAGLAGVWRVRRARPSAIRSRFAGAARSTSIFRIPRCNPN